MKEKFKCGRRKADKEEDLEPETPKSYTLLPIFGVPVAGSRQWYSMFLRRLCPISLVFKFRRLCVTVRYITDGTEAAMPGSHGGL